MENQNINPKESFLSDDEVIKLYELMLSTSPNHPSHNVLQSILSREMNIRGYSLLKFYKNYTEKNKKLNNFKSRPTKVEKIDGSIIKKPIKKLNPNSIEEELENRLKQLNNITEEKN